MDNHCDKLVHESLTKQKLQPVFYESQRAAPPNRYGSFSREEGLYYPSTRVVALSVGRCGAWCGPALIIEMSLRPTERRVLDGGRGISRGLAHSTCGQLLSSSPVGRNGKGCTETFNPEK